VPLHSRRPARSDPNGIRTRVTAVKGRCPGPLDDRVKAGQYRNCNGWAQGKLVGEFKVHGHIAQIQTGAPLSMSESELVNQLGCSCSSALVFVQHCMRISHEALARLAVAEKLANGTLERVGIVNLHCGVV
jgi:hypothetical protein